MRERKDLHCLHEPFMYDYYMNPQRPHSTRDMPHFSPQTDHPNDYAAIRNMILEQAKATPVFFKDMSYYMTPYLDSDGEFFSLVQHGFLIRNPKAAIASYFAMDKAVGLEEIGIEAQWLHVNALQRAGIQPYVLEAEAVQNEPLSQIKNWWNAMGLTPKESALSWNSEIPRAWTQVQAWHEATIANNTIRKRSKSDGEIEQQRFDDAAVKAPHLLDYLEHHTPFYERLRRLAAENQRSTEA